MATCGDCGAVHERPRAVRCHACSQTRQRNQVIEWHRQRRAQEKIDDPIFCCECNVEIKDRRRCSKRCWTCSAVVKRQQRLERDARRKAERAAAKPRFEEHVQ